MTPPSGPPATPPPGAYLGIDVGGTKIAAGVVLLPEGRILARRQVPTLPARDGAEILDDVTRLASTLRDEAGAQGWRVSGIGIGLCELVDTRQVVLSHATLPWDAPSIGARLQAIAPVSLEADVRAAALAEGRFGAGCGYPYWLYVTVGTGISSCLVMGGTPIPGARGIAGTFASSPLPTVDGRPAPTLEECSSGPALVARYRSLGGMATTGHDVMAAAGRGDAGAIEILRSAGRSLGASIGWLVNTLDPGAVVLGGGLGLEEGIYREHLVAAARAQIWSDIHRGVPILSARLGKEAGIIGAAVRSWLSAA